MTKLIKNLALIFLLTFAISCNGTKGFSSYKKGVLEIPSGEKIEVYMAISYTEQKQGLSNVKPEDFNDNEGMFFYYEDDGVRHFWMPETYFDLDIVYLNKDLYVLEVHRSLKHFPHKGPEHKVPRAKPVVARHAVELKASSEISKKIEPGMMLKWAKEPNL